MAAGKGTRLEEVTQFLPKGLLEINNKTLLEISLEKLERCGIKEVIIVIGYYGDKIKEKIGNKFNSINITYIENSEFENTNNMFSLSLAKNFIDENNLILESDLLYELDSLKSIIDSPRQNVTLVSTLSNSNDEGYVFLDESNNLKDIIVEDKKESSQGELVGITKLSGDFCEELFKISENEYLQGIKNQPYYENFLKTSKKIPLGGVVKDMLWVGINHKNDLNFARDELIKQIEEKENTKFKKILLIQPSNIIPEESIRRLIIPMGLLYVGASLREKGYEVEIIDSPCEGYENNISHKNGYINYGLSDESVKDRIKEYKPDIVGITSLFSSQRNNAIHHCDLVKSVDENIPVILGGIHPSLDPLNSIKNNSVDYVIIGEGEYRFLDLLSSLEKNQEPDFDGIAYKADEEVKINPRTKRIENLDALPLPARDLVDMKKYMGLGVPINPFTKESRIGEMITSRGCVFDCIFCPSVQFWNHGIRMRSINSIFEEVDELVNNYGAKEIQFFDDNLTLDKERAKEIFRRLADYNISWCTPNGLMAQTLDKEMIGLMAKSGAYQLTFAIESGSERVLKEIVRKKIPEKEKIKELIDECHNCGLQVHGLFVIGFPGETREEIEQTLNYPKEVGFDSVSFYLANPMLGSRLYYLCKEKGWLRDSSVGDIKGSEIIIPEDSPDYILSNKELEILIENKQKEFNEFSKIKNPGAWDKKFQQFLKRHGDKADLILGRST